MKKEMLPDTKTFTDKYTKKNFISDKILKNFFTTLVSLIPKEIKTLKEVGCGAGFSTKELVDAFPHIKISGSDLDPELITQARTLNPSINFDIESIYTLSSGDNSSDLVLCLEVLEHLENPKQALLELKRITSKYIIVSTPREPLWCIANTIRGKYWRSFGNTPGHINHWSKKELTKFISSEFQVLEVKSPFPWTIILAEKI
jgi:2-polyprenyl-3-methyl-5-hydroxy-6-metoxy-1,4-benzoquinol methylase